MSTAPLSRKLALLAVLMFAFPALAGCASEPAAPAAADDMQDKMEPEPTTAPAMARIGILQLSDALSDTEKGFKEEMAARGYVEGKNVQYVYRHAKGDIPALGGLAAEIAAEEPLLIFALTTPASKAALAATEAMGIPVIGAPVLNPVPAGLAASFSTPGGRFTGVSPLVDASKQVEVLRASLPTEASRIGIITSGDHDAFLEQFTAAAAPMGFTVNKIVVKTPDEVTGAFETISSSVDVLYIPPDNIVTNRATFLIEESKANKIALMMPTEAMVKDGAFVSYSADYVHMGRQAARQVANVLNEGNVATMPIEVPERTRLAVNLVTAAAVGIEVPDEVLARASTVIR